MEVDGMKEKRGGVGNSRYAWTTAADWEEVSRRGCEVSLSEEHSVGGVPRGMFLYDG